MFNIALNIFLICSPILFLSMSVPGLPTLQFYQFGCFGNSIALVQLQIFCYGVIFLFIAAMFSRPKRLIKDTWLGVLVFIYIASIYFHPKTIKIFPIILFGFLLYYLVSMYVDARKIKYLFIAIVIAASLNTFFAILQQFGIHWIYQPKENNEIIGLMSYKTQLGIYQAISIPICYAINPWLTFIPIIGLLLSKSGTALTASVIGMIFLFRKEIKKYVNMTILMSFISLSVFFLITHWHQLSLRFWVWIETFNLSIERIWVGHGLEPFILVEQKVGVAYQHQDSYSIYLGILYATGIFGLLAFLYFIKDKFDFFGGNTLKISCLILLISGLGYSFMDYPRLAGTAIVLFGLLNAVKMEA